jgi:glycosyltransferase involved in cell wall biosynthesis
MRIAFFVEGRPGWMAGYTYLYNLLKAIRLADEQIEICLLRRPDEDIVSPAARALTERANHVLECPTLNLERWSLRWTQAQFYRRILRRDYPDRRLNGFLEANRIDAVFGSWWQYPRSSVFPSVEMSAWVHDFQFLHLPDLYDIGTLQTARSGIPEMVDVADTVVVSSQDGLKDLLAFVPGAAGKARVLPFVADVPAHIYESDPDAVVRQYHLPDRFIYLPNQFWQHKNHRQVIGALHILSQRGIHPYVVCTGLPHDHKKPAHVAELLTLISEWGLHQQMILLGLVPIDHVKALMRQALCVLNPSLFEGWSSTVEEAKSLGKSLLLSALPVHREQNPPGTLFFDHQDPEDLAIKLETVWQDWRPGPDLQLEAMARQELPGRLRQFGEAFLSIVSGVATTRS